MIVKEREGSAAHGATLRILSGGVASFNHGKLSTLLLPLEVRLAFFHAQGWKEFYEFPCRYLDNLLLREKRKAAEAVASAIDDCPLKSGQSAGCSACTNCLMARSAAVIRSDRMLDVALPVPPPAKRVACSAL